MKKKPATWVTMEASCAVTEWMSALQQGILQAAEAKLTHKNSGVCIELSDVHQALPVACQALLESVMDQSQRKSVGRGKVA